MMPRVLSATVDVWVEGAAEIESGVEDDLMRTLADALTSGQTGLVASDGRRCRTVLVAAGQTMHVEPVEAVLPNAGLPVARVNGLVTTARTPGVAGHVVRDRTSGSRTRWVFVAGMDPFEFARRFVPTMQDADVEDANFVPTAAAERRRVRKQILGFR